MKKVFSNARRFWYLGIVLLILLVAAKEEIPAMQKSKDFLAALFFPTSVTLEELRAHYRDHILTVLVVPGHDSEASGTEFRNIREADLTLGVAKYLVTLLGADPAFRVFTTRETGDYTKIFQDYFEYQEAAINQFKKEKGVLIKAATQVGFEERSAVIHNNANRDTVFKLYGINKWANDQHIDIVLHIHFNDYAGRRLNQVGQYAGFTVYIPERQLPNAKASRALAQPLFNQLNTILAVSNLPQESAGIVEEQELIAVGARTSLDAAALLVEYGYIYESPFREPAVKEKFLQELAYQTYLGLKKGLDPGIRITPEQSSLLLPHQWNRKLSSGIRGDADVLALQVALTREGVYPPPGRDCPVSSNFFDCTEAAVKAFQEKYELKNNGITDTSTLKKLNELYGASAL